MPPVLTAEFFQTFNYTIASFFARPTQFASHWVGPMQQEAIDFAAHWDIDYQSPPAQKLVHPTTGQHLTRGGGQLVESRLRKANNFYNHLTEIHHLRDSNYDTGTDHIQYRTTKWYLATRGQRLRTLPIQLSLWREEKRLGKLRVRVLEKASQIAVGGREILYARMALCEARVDGILHGQILATIVEVQAMVMEKVNDGWDWKVGLRAQLDARDRLYLVEITSLSAVGIISFKLAALIPNVY